MTEPQEPRSTAPEHLTSEELSEYAYSPHDAAAGLREHAEGCAACAAEVADLRLVLATLADLPEPAFPVEVGIRLDAALERAWQEADAGQQDAATSASAAGAAPTPAPASATRRGPRLSWRRFAPALAALGLIVVAGVGLGFALSHGSGSSSSASGSSAAAPDAASDSALTQWVQSVLITADSAGATGAGVGPQVQSGTKSSGTKGTEQTTCASYPQRPGYTLLTSAEREFEGRAATLVVYRNDQEPASNTVFAVAYAGSCPTVSSPILDQGVVSR